ncbi:VOC family protein [Halobacterium sp. KA-6]|uniref:VOC family protein n=1 Tax=Halobacterium sp. KA-6 TaxID=2896368 RepID=UPI001E4CAC26|nr:VOC family protein [Halobacterium sp. KA-6]MCD2204043.1 VOC family protein [Halobacterium sp. KA-6]
MAERTDVPVTADRPDSQLRVQGTDHITVEGTDPGETIQFYRDILGMPLVLSQPNLDRSELTHLFFETGDGRLLTFFVTDERDSASLSDPAPGHVHHLAFRIEGKRINEIKTALDDAGHSWSEYDRGAFHSLYTEDNNGLTIELVAEKFTIPDDRRSAVLATAHQKRVADDAEFVTERHMREALAELGIEAEQRDLNTAPAGRDV